MIKFESEGAAPFEMLEDHALSLISLMGQGQRGEGSISGDALSSALSKLNSGLAKSPEPSGSDNKNDDEWDESEEESVALSTHAFPLKQMLQHAIANETYLMWRAK